ncbi:ABC-2 type transport system permease protein [Mucilaginibacter oryzae]|uniref:ABC-2 type transport system permease protein n=1 Tax=Mucilaginibacter oryzae TaxID=468058 RepID=A0A316H9T6_9SPHI|nr:DUF3526 domain-containing protein [Mucilaginibacter oryzae]PWK77247.1 ABC-2 type transport system permease protein [Mucilaginibacter oryzae]
MKKIKIIAGKEFRSGLRSPAWYLAGGLFLLLTLLVLISGYRNYRQRSQERTAAVSEQRSRWLHQDPKHPHIAAHFGNFAFMPQTPLSFFDHGLDDFTGTVAYLEPHRQNEFAFKPAESAGAVSRFGVLTASMILQVIFPLIIIFISFDAFSREFEQQTIQLLYSQGISFRQLYLGKLVGFSLLLAVLLAPVMITLAALAGTDREQWLRMILLGGLYGLYFIVILALSLLCSAYLRNSRFSLLLLTALWVMITIVLPKWAASTGDGFFRLPTKNTFDAAIHHDLLNGINGHDPSGARAQKLKSELLRKYKVDTVAKLPFNFDGYIMEAGEEYSSRVYDRHFAQLQQTLIRQNQLTQWCGLIDPFIAVNGLSMALAGTDYYSHLAFQRQSEQYRRRFVQQMNHEMEVHSKMGDWDYRSDRRVFAAVPPFRYRPQGLMASISNQLPGMISLMIWLILIGWLVQRYPAYLNQS